MFCRMRRWRKEILALDDMRFRVFDALCKRFGACLVGDDGRGVSPANVQEYKKKIMLTTFFVKN